MADRGLSPEEQVLALATKRAIQAAGGLEICERETDVSDTQLSRCCSPNHRDSITIRDAVTIEAISHGRDGHPHILRAMARAIGGCAVVLLVEPDDAHESCLRSAAIELTVELGDFQGALLDAFRASSAGGEAMTPAEAALAIEQLDDVDRVSTRLRHRLENIARGAREPSS